MSNNSRPAGNRVLASLMVAVLCALAVLPSAQGGAVDDINWRAVKRCGPNSLYVTLLMTGHQVDYESLIESTELTEQGVSVAELLRVASKFGMPMHAWRAHPDDLPSFSMPAIVHLETDWQGMGHFVVLLRVNRNGSFTIAECTNGELRNYARDEFLDRWSGVVIARESLASNAVWSFLLSISAGLLIVWIVVALLTGRRRAQMNAQGAGAVSAT